MRNPAPARATILLSKRKTITEIDLGSGWYATLLIPMRKKRGELSKKERRSEATYGRAAPGGCPKACVAGAVEGCVCGMPSSWAASVRKRRSSASREHLDSIHATA